MSASVSGGDRKQLKQCAHDLKPVVMIGKEGVSEALLLALDQALRAHELIKVRFIEKKDARQSISEEIADTSGAALVGLIGHVAILYKPHADPEKRKYGVALI